MALLAGRPGVAGVGFGWITLRRRSDGAGVHRLEEWPHAVEQPIASAIGGWLAVCDNRPGRDLLDERLSLRADVVQETSGTPGAADPATIVLRQQRGFRRARSVDTVEAAAAGACDGDLTLGDILDAVAHLLDRDPADLRTIYLPRLTELVEDGYLELS